MCLADLTLDGACTSVDAPDSVARLCSIAYKVLDYMCAELHYPLWRLKAQSDACEWALRQHACQDSQHLFTVD